MTLKKQTDFLGADVVIDAVDAEADDNLLQLVTAAKLKLQGGSPIALVRAIDSAQGSTASVVGAYGPLFSAVTFGDAVNKGRTSTSWVRAEDEVVASVPEVTPSARVVDSS